MEPICISANSAVYKAGSLMVVAALLSIGDAIFLVTTGVMQTYFALPVAFMFVFGCYGMIAGAFDLMKWQRAKTTPALLLRGEGIMDATSTIMGGLVLWSAVRSVSKVRMNDRHLLAFQLASNATYLARLPAWKRFLLSPNVALYGTPLLVSESELAVSAEKARTIIESMQRSILGEILTVTLPQPSAHWWTAVPPEERAVVPLRCGR